MSSDEESAVSESEQSSVGGISYSPSGEMYHDSDGSNLDDTIPYDTSAEPLATPEEHAEYQRVISLQRQEQQQLNIRFSGEQSIDSWCKCGNCSLEFVVKPDECRCCFDIDQCKQKMAEEKLNDRCLTKHPGFGPVCLNPWVLRIAGISFKTKIKGAKNYTSLYMKGKKSESEFFRAVAYRQFVRLVWDYTGSSTRYPLPCCVYSRIRKEFKSQEYTGYEEEEENSDS